MNDVATPDEQITPRQRRIEEWIGHHDTLCDPAQPHAARLAAWQAIQALEAGDEAEADGGEGSEGMAGVPAGAARAWAWVPFAAPDRWGVFSAAPVQARIQRAVARGVNVAALDWIEGHVQRAVQTSAPNSLASDEQRGEHEGVSSLYLQRRQVEGAGREAAARAWYRELQLAEWALDGVWPDTPLPATVAVPAINSGDGGADDAAAVVPVLEVDDADAAADPESEPEPEPAPAAPAAAAHLSMSRRARWWARMQMPRRRVVVR